MSENNRHRESLPRSTAEWISLCMALLILGSLVAVIVFLWLREDGKPVRFRLEVGAIRVEDRHFYLPVEVFNEGDETAAQVRLVGELKAEGKEETAETTFDYVPGHSSERGVLVFVKDPSRAVVRVTSYQIP